MQENWVWKKKPFSWGQAWIDLLIRTSWIDSTMFSDHFAKSLKVRRGEIICSIRGLAFAWGWSRSGTERFLRRCQQAGQIKATSEGTYTRIKILNWSKLQGQEPEGGFKSGTRKSRKPGRGKGHSAGPLNTPDNGEKTNPHTPSDPEARDKAVARSEQAIGLIEEHDTRNVFLEFLATLEFNDTIAAPEIVDRVTAAMNAREQLKLNPGAPVERIIRYALTETMRRKARSGAYTDKVILNALQRWRDGKFTE